MTHLMFTHKIQVVKKARLFSGAKTGDFHIPLYMLWSLTVHARKDSGVFGILFVGDLPVDLDVFIFTLPVISGSFGINRSSLCVAHYLGSIIFPV